MNRHVGPIIRKRTYEYQDVMLTAVEPDETWGISMIHTKYGAHPDVRVVVVGANEDLPAECDGRVNVILRFRRLRTPLKMVSNS